MDIYGRSPIIEVLADVKAFNEPERVTACALFVSERFTRILVESDIPEALFMLDERLY